MALYLEESDTVQLTLLQTLFGQRVMNVLHYKVLGNPGTTSTYFDWLNAFADKLLEVGNLVPRMLACQTTELQLDSMRLQKTWPVRLPFLSRSILLPGDVDDNAVTPNIALSITKRTETANKHGVGRFQLGGVPTGAIGAGVFQPGAFLTAADALANEISTTYPVTSSAVTIEFQPVLTTDIPIHLTTPIIGTEVQTTVRDMRRRTVGLGI